MMINVNGFLISQQTIQASGQGITCLASAEPRRTARFLAIWRASEHAHKITQLISESAKKREAFSW